MPRKSKVESFKSFVKKSLERKGFTLVLVDDHSVELGGGLFSSGYFDDQNKVLKVATKRDQWQWLAVLVHEFCHFLQYIEDCDAWRNCYVGKTDANTIVDNWLAGDDSIHYRLICNYIERVQMLEFDCEKRSVEMIKQFNLPISIRKYTRAACAYVHFHNCMAETRQWVKRGYKISEDDKLLNLVPCTLNQDFLHTPQKLMDYMKKNCI